MQYQGIWGFEAINKTFAEAMNLNWSSNLRQNLLRTTGMEKELDKETCIDMLIKLIFEYGQQEFYLIRFKNEFVRMLENHIWLLCGTWLIALKVILL